jgi:ssDNA-binding Zn-finger/Zn-ribbon topoisomerase 1
MAEKKAKTAEKGGAALYKRTCPSCGSESRVTYFTGFGRKGYFWVCDKNCGYTERTR